jgi:phospholipid/cholesterol/gamma-HCH transport system permease protein
MRWACFLSFALETSHYNSASMSVAKANTQARVSTQTEGDRMVVTLAGHWRVTESRPKWTLREGPGTPKRIRLEVAEVEKWDSSLLLFVFDVQQWCRMAGVYCDLDALPEKTREMLGQLSRSHETSVPFDRSENFLTAVGLATQDAWMKCKDISSFVGECAISQITLLKHPERFRWRDCVDEMQQCGAMALPIVSLISVLVGMTLAYTGALILRQYGGDIYVADLVGVSMVREMGALMTGIVLAGRTGAAFAAQLGNMRANEEIDAFTTLGISPVEFLVMPRLIALGLMMPLLGLYANCLGILGGMFVAMSVLGIPPAAYWVEMLTIVDMSDVLSGIIKAGTFGVIIGVSGCLRGLQAERSAMGVGKAATSAVVTAILFIIVADAVYAVLFDILGI